MSFADERRHYFLPRSSMKGFDDLDGFIANLVAAIDVSAAKQSAQDEPKFYQGPIGYGFTHLFVVRTSLSRGTQVSRVKGILGRLVR